VGVGRSILIRLNSAGVIHFAHIGNHAVGTSGAAAGKSSGKRKERGKTIFNVDS